VIDKNVNGDKQNSVQPRNTEVIAKKVGLTTDLKLEENTEEIRSNQ
jgi:hypothetical protein